ncbi:sulfotransferase [Sphingomonas sp. PAMC 26621]|uniref:sulfotransferase n=1 Tax=Sphingomonas sp. PAMC 26621 TaxID=1112213 RepID=UPI000287BF38|nr:sulfotransferase [Sphingomonas sp. PAMC 26621]
MISPQPNGMTIEQALGQASAHWNAGQADQAERLCQHVLALWPGQSDALHLMGLMAHAYGNLDIAIDHLRRACQAPRVHATYLSNLAEMCRQKGLLPEAEDAARRGVTMDPAMVAGWNNLGIILQESGKLEESLSCLERVLALQPDYPEAHNNLGNTLKRLGRLEQARGQYEAALRLSPAYAEAMSNLSNLLNDLGQPDEALALARRAIDTNPRLSDAYINAAAVEVGRDRPAEALRWVDALLSYAPLHVGGLGVRATALQHLGRLDEALTDARRAVAAAPDSGEAHNILGEVLQAQNAIGAAIAAFDRAATSVGFAPEKALTNRGVALMERGDRDAAIATFERVLDQYPRSIGAWFNLADLRRFSAGDPAIAAMEALLASGGIESHADRTALRFALGKAWLDVGDAERGFAHLDQGNREKRATFSYDPAATDQWISEIIAAFPPARFERPPADVPGSDRPVFVVGVPRSGTTLVEQILASHSAVVGAGELATLQGVVRTAGPFPACATGLGVDDEATLGRAYVDAIEPLVEGHRRMVDKMPSNFLYAGLIHRLLPDARIIHVRRDPVDTCLSCYSKLFTREQLFAYDLAELGLFYRSYDRLMAHWRAVLPADRFIEVRYEDIVSDLETESRRLVAFCGLDWDPACLHFHRTGRIVRTASVNQVRQPLHADSVGRWRKYARHLTPLTAALGIDAEVPVPSHAPKTRAKRAAVPVAS